MRLITPEEDKFLENIAILKEDIRNLETDIMSDEMGLKGNRRKKGQSFMNFTVWLMVSIVLFLFVMGYIISGLTVGIVLSMAVLFAAGGAGFFCIACWVITFIQFLKFISSVSNNKFFNELAVKLNVNSLASEKNDYMNNLRDNRRILKLKKEKLQELTLEYDNLKLEKDKEFLKNTLNSQAHKYDEMDIQKGSNYDFENSNYQVQFNWLEQKSTIKGDLNKAKVDYYRIQMQKEELEGEAQEDCLVIDDIQNSRRSMFIFSLALIIVAVCVFCAAFVIEPGTILVQLLGSSVLIVIFSIFVFLLVQIFTSPFVSSSGFAVSLSNTLGIYAAMKHFKDTNDEISKLDSQLIELKEVIDALQRDFDDLEDKNDDMPYNY